MEVVIITLLVIGSIVGLTLIIERGLALRWKKVIPPGVEKAVQTCRTEASLLQLRATCNLYPSPISRLLLLAESHREWPIAENTDAIQTHARHEIVRLERGLVILEIIVGTAPLLGLVGTIFGLITLFGDIGQSGLGENTVIARGIAIALNATLMGLLTAIPSLIAWSYYNKKIETMAVEMETLCHQFLRCHYSAGDTAPKTIAARPRRTVKRKEGGEPEATTASETRSQPG